MKQVLDASFFFADYPSEGELFTTPSVVGELRDLSAKCRFENLLARGLKVREPVPEALDQVEQASGKTGDRSVISRTDRDLLALALMLGAGLHTDDFALQNVAQSLGIPVTPLRQRRAQPIRWKFRCAGCGRYYREAGECPVCGAAIKRKLK